MPRKGVVLFSNVRWENGCSCNSHIPALEPVANRPIAYHVLDAMLAAGADQLVIAGTADVLIDVRACLSRYRSKPVRLDYAVCNTSADPIGMFRAAARLVGAAPCIVHVGEGLLDHPITPYVESLQNRSLDLVLLCQPLSSAGAPQGSLINEDAVAPTVRSVPWDASIGVFGPGAFRDAVARNPGTGPLGLGVLAQQLSDDGEQVQMTLADGWRSYRGDPQELLELNRLALDLLVPKMRYASGGQNQIEGRVHIDRTASVTTSVIVGPVVIGEGAEVTNAYLGPYTSVGAGAQIEGAEIERSIISPGARVMHVGTRLVSSLVGRGAHVFRDFSLPRAMRLRVGEGNEVAVC
jgi:glucose-1-phosphate thymidylyltransferase